MFSSLVGAIVKRKEDPRLITGVAKYTGDIQVPGQHYVAFVRSPYAHAEIRGIDKTAALKMPGVVAVITGADLPMFCGPMPAIGESEGGPSAEPRKPFQRYPLPSERVRHAGEAVAAVIADTPARAEDAAFSVVVDYAPLPAVADVLQALESGAPQLYADRPRNTEIHSKRAKGDPDAAFASAHRIIKQRMVSQRLAGVSMETRATLVVPDPASGGVTVWSSTQNPHGVRSELASALSLPENSVRVIAPEVGGGFGIKIGAYPEDVLLTALALKFNLPLRWVETRTEHMLATTHGRGQVADVEAAVQSDGTVTALRLRVVNDLGAYPLAPWLPGLTGLLSVGVYRIPSVALETMGVLTNTTPIAAYRGAARPEAAYYIERLMDLVALELNLDPITVRRQNFIPPDAFPYKTPTGATYDSGEYDKALSKVIEISHLSALRAEQQQRLTAPGTRHLSPLLGIGLATYVEICAPGPYESALVRVEPSGEVTVMTGISPHGQGQETTFAQLIADKIGADFDKITVKHGDTLNTPHGIGTYGSRGLAVGGSAVVRAGASVQAKAIRLAALILEAAPEDIVLANGAYQVKGLPSRTVNLKDIAARAYSDNLPADMDGGLEATDFFRPPGSVFPFGAHVAVVEIDRETGAVTVRDFFTVDDCGPRISPLLAEGQIHGGLAQGIGQALWEEVVFDESGQMLSGSLLEYAVPHADSFPMFVTDQTETPTPNNPLGAKGIGEAATIGSTPAIANAVMDALKPFGVKHVDMPLTPEKIWRAMQTPSPAGRGLG